MVVWERRFQYIVYLKERSDHFYETTWEEVGSFIYLCPKTLPAAYWYMYFNLLHTLYLESWSSILSYFIGVAFVW